MKSTVIAVLAAASAVNAGQVVSAGTDLPGLNVGAGNSYGGKPSESYPPPTSTSSTLSVVYTTELHTVTSCAPEITNCPAKQSPSVVTSTIALYTTYCPVEASESKPSGAVSYTTETLTISSCAPEVTSCPHKESPTVITYTHPLETTTNSGEVTSVPTEQKPTPTPYQAPPVYTPPYSAGKPAGYASASSGLTTYVKPGVAAPTEVKGGAPSGVAQPSSGSESSGQTSSGQYLTGAATTVQAGSFAAFVVLAAAAMMM